MIKLIQDSRDALFHQKFGQVSQFPVEFDVDTPIPDDIQPIGDEKCTCYTACDIASDEVGVQYDIDDLWSRIPHTAGGANPRDALGQTTKNGLKRRDTGQIEKKWSSYWSAHTGQYDAFDNVRSALTMTVAPVAVWTNWYAEWRVGIRGVMPLGQRITSSHMYDIQGWKEVNGQPMLIVQAWQGYTMYMPRETFNAAVAVWGCGTAVLSTSEIDAKRTKSLWESILDQFKNLVINFNKWKSENSIALKSNEDIITDMKPTDKDYVYNVSYMYIGKHLSLDETVPIAFGCAQSLSYVLIHAGYSIPEKGISSTIALHDWLSKNCNEITTPEFGDIIISVTQGGNHGHCGIVGHNAIMSNDSQTGLWEPYWSLPAWIEFYKNQKKLVTKYFRVR